MLNFRPSAAPGQLGTDKVRASKLPERSEILAGLDVRREFEELGIRFTGSATAKGWAECHAYGRDDHNPSAGVNLETGRYHDCGPGEESIDLFDLAFKLGVGRTIGDTMRHYAERAGLTADAKPKGGKTLGRCVATYVYHDADRSPVLQVRRYDPKDFRQFRPDGRGGWIGGRTGVVIVPYRLPELLESAESDVVVFVVEGEKDADNLATLGLVATTAPEGAKQTTPEKGKPNQHLPCLAGPLTGRRVVVLADNDVPGRLHAEAAAAVLHGHAASIKVVGAADLPGPTVGSKGDVSDWLAMGGDPAELVRLAEAAPFWTPRVVIPMIGNDAADDGDIKPVETPDDPHRLARIFIAGHRIDGEDGVVAHCGDLYRRRDGYFQLYRDVESDAVGCIRDEFERINREEIRDFRDRAREAGQKVDPNDLPKIRHVKRTLVAETLMAVRSETCLSSHVSPPCWLADDADGLPDPSNIIVVRNGLLDVATRKLYPHTARYFSLNAPLSFDYDPLAPPPGRWRQFLDEVWANDREVKRELQKWVGYALTPATDQQKILLVVGPTRSGKGTIQRLLQSLLGPHNATYTSLSTLASPFGLQPLLGHSLAMIPDAKFCGRTAEMAAAVERLVSVSGEDAQSINRKYKDEMVVRLPLKFFIFANDTPNLRDQSGALAYRIAPLEMTTSFRGREDKGLDAKLAAERSGILNWALDGIDMLREDGGFLVPDSCKQLHQAIVETTSPTKAFIADCINVVPDDDRSAHSHPKTEEVYHAYRVWCRDNGNRAASSSVFGRNLRAAEPDIDDYRPTVNGVRDRRLKGVELNEKGRRLASRFASMFPSEAEGGEF